MQPVPDTINRNSRRWRCRRGRCRLGRRPAGVTARGICMKTGTAGQSHGEQPLAARSPQHALPIMQPLAGTNNPTWIMNERMMRWNCRQEQWAMRFRPSNVPQPQRTAAGATRSACVSKQRHNRAAAPAHHGAIIVAAPRQFNEILDRLGRVLLVQLQGPSGKWQSKVGAGDPGAAAAVPQHGWQPARAAAARRCKARQRNASARQCGSARGSGYSRQQCRSQARQQEWIATGSGSGGTAPLPHLHLERAH